MNRKLTKASYLLCVAGAVVCAQAPRHIGLTKTDAFVLCAQRTFGKPIIVENYPVFGDRVKDLSCAARTGELVESLTSHRLKVFEAGDWVFVMGSGGFDPRVAPENPGRVQWTDVRVNPDIENYRLVEVRTLSDTELQRIGQTIFSGSRVIPVSVPLDLRASPIVRSSAEGDTMVVRPLLLLAARSLGHGAIESVVGLWLGAGGQPGRLVYGEMMNGRYEMLWDSPLFPVWQGNMFFADVNGDGVQEIVVRGLTGVGRDTDRWMTIFDIHGNELTRQRPCDVGDLFDYEPEGIACSIAARDVSLRPNSDGTKKEIWATDPPDLAPGTYRFRLEGGRFIMSNQPIVPSRPRKR
jgi:hypothetical protein